jgi:hypothetical protein
MRRHWSVCGLCAVVLAGTASVRPTIAAAVDDKLPDDSKAALSKSAELELILLWPYADKEPKPGKDYFHGYEVSGRVTLKGDDARKLSDAVFKGVEEGGSKALCFEPHHAVRAVYDGKTYDFVICFRCKQIYCYDSKAKFAACVKTSDSPQKALDQLFSDAKPAKEKPDK